jgi:hypothetical protein
MSTASDPPDEEFRFALHLAIEVGVLDWLRAYVAAGKPIPDEDVQLKGWSDPKKMPTLVAELLGDPPQQVQQKRGRPPRIANEAPKIKQAERNATWLVAGMLKKWRLDHGREKVPPDATRKMIRSAIPKAARTFRVPADAIKESKIRALLKTGRFVVR